MENKNEILNDNKSSNDLKNIDKRKQDNGENAENRKTNEFLFNLFFIFGVFVFGIVLAWGIYYGYQYFFEKNKPFNTNQYSGSKKSDNLTFNKKINEEADTSPDLIKKGSIKWQEPRLYGDLGLTTKENYEGQDWNDDTRIFSGGVKYVKAGEIIKGKYAGSEFFVIMSWISEGPFFQPDIFRIIKKENDYIFLGNYLGENKDYYNDLLRKYFFGGTGKKTINNKIIVEELSFPENIKSENERQVLTKDKWVNAFFNNDKLKPIFKHINLGQVWMTDGIKAVNKNPSQFELNSMITFGGPDGRKKEVDYFDVFDRYGFYIKAPDGTTVAYKLKFDIFEDEENFSVIKGTWSNGEKISVEYEKAPTGCGSNNYVYDKTLSVSLSQDVKEIGKTDRGDSLFGYKNAFQPDLFDLYNEKYTQYYEAKKGKEKPKKMNRDEYLQTNPVIFWVDPFGRTLAFYRADLINPAECAKPVIYLYPEQEMDVSVKVEPSGGITFSNPNYGSGWNVRADSKGEILNYSDNKNYPYLFWEGKSDSYYKIPSNGFVVEKNSLSGFLSDKLGKFGLIEKEIFDFKEFWLPIMLDENKPYYFVTFISQKDINEIAPLLINPKPDTIIRVMMDYRGLDKKEESAEYPIITPERKGFTVVEWGGVKK